MRVCAAALAVCLATAPLVACGGSRPPPPVEKAPAEPHWQDVFDTVPELLVVVRAQAAQRDRVYGPLLRRALELSREQSKVVAGTRVLEAMSDSDEIIVGLRPDTGDVAGELVLVARGVRGDIDPASLVDDSGRVLWSQGPPGDIVELVRDKDERGHPVDASLFELPGRTWVIAQGPARNRAREAFAHPFNRPSLSIDPQALAVVRFDGSSLVNHVRALQDLGGLAAIGRHLRWVTLTLPPGLEHTVTATLSYADDDSAAYAEVATRETLSALSRSKNLSFSWLATAHVEHSPRTVSITAPLPAQLVRGLLGMAGLVDLDLPPTAPRPSAP